MALVSHLGRPPLRKWTSSSTHARVGETKPVAASSRDWGTRRQICRGVPALNHPRTMSIVGAFGTQQDHCSDAERERPVQRSNGRFCQVQAR